MPTFNRVFEYSFQNIITAKSLQKSRKDFNSRRKRFPLLEPVRYLGYTVLTNAGFHGAYPHTYTQEVGVGGVLVPHGGEVLHHGGDGDVGEDERGEWRWVGDGR